MAFKYGGILFVSHFFIISCVGQNLQNHLLKYVNVGATTMPSDPAQFSSSMDIRDLRNVRNRFSKADRLCVRGMWALYNNTDFGEGAEGSSTVISLRGTDITRCTNPGQIPVLKNVRSLIFLGSRDYSQDGVLIYSEAYMLGGLWRVVNDGVQALPLPDHITGFPLGSLAITGTNAWVICGDRDTPCSNGVCVDMKNYANLFLQRNIVKDNSLTRGWPRTVRKVESVTSEVCLNYVNPAPINSRRLFKRDASEDGIEISVFEMPS